MSVEQQIETLRTEHQSLEADLDEEMHRPSPDTMKIKQIKREKLRIKDQIAVLQADA